MTIRTKLAAVVAAVVLVGVPVLAGPASAAGEDGLWWYDAIGVGDYVAAGATGAGVTIGVVDGQISPDVPVLAGADVQVHEPSFCATALESEQNAPAASTELTDSSSHGTNVVSMIVGTGRGYPGQAQAVAGIAPKATVRFYATSFGDDSVALNGVDRKTNCPFIQGPAISPIAYGIMQAVDDGAKIISLSVGDIISGGDLKAVEWALHEGVIIVAAIPNKVTENSSFQDMNGVVSVGGVGPDLKPAMNTEGLGGATDVMAPGAQMLLQGDSTTRSWQGTEIGQGNSYATPLVSGMLAAVWSKYPQATGNQILQSLIHNTGAQDHELYHDKTFGYGLMSEAHMLRVDPTQYEDVNPLLTADGIAHYVASGADFTAAQVASATRPDWAPPLPGAAATPTGPAATPQASGASAPDLAARSGVAVLWWVLGAGLLLVVGVVLTVTLSRRSRTPAGRGAPPAPR